jgi:hypothetical protein
MGNKGIPSLLTKHPAFEAWEVQLAGGGETRMTVAELDQALQTGAVSASTRVRRPGTWHWVTLGIASNLDSAARMAGGISARGRRYNADAPTATEARPRRRSRKLFYFALFAALIGGGLYGANRRMPSLKGKATAYVLAHIPQRMLGAAPVQAAPPPPSEPAPPAPPAIAAAPASRPAEASTTPTTPPDEAPRTSAPKSGKGSKKRADAKKSKRHAKEP